MNPRDLNTAPDADHRCPPAHSRTNPNTTTPVSPSGQRVIHQRVRLLPHARAVAAGMAGAAVLVSHWAGAEQTMQEYAAECDAQIGVTVPEFDCREGTLVPGQDRWDPETGEYSEREFRFSGPCDNPQMFNHGSSCNPGTTFKVLHDDSDAYVVAICRKNGESVTNSELYDDVAILQHNKNNGATCFYQRDLNSHAVIPAPSAADDGGWDEPGHSVYNGCPSCHDNGALVRSPFLTAIDGPDALPATGDLAYNHQDHPYWLPGEHYQHFQPFNVDADGNRCTSCHRMGAMGYRSDDGNGPEHRLNQWRGNIRLAHVTVKTVEELHNPPEGEYDVARAMHEDNPNNNKWWMPFGRGSDDSTMGACSSDVWEQEWRELESCKQRFVDENLDASAATPLSMPNDPSCRVTPVAGVRDKPALKKLHTGEPYEYRMHDYGNTGTFIYTQGGDAVGGYAGSYLDSGLWSLSNTSGDVYTFMDRESGEYLCHAWDEDSDWLGSCASLNDPVYWVLEFVNDRDISGERRGLVYRLRSAYYPELYIHAEGGSLAIGSIEHSWDSALWAMRSENCVDSCGGISPGSCWCDELCVQFGDCCNDKVDSCDLPAEVIYNPPPSCQGSCDGRSPDGCWCDDLCTGFGDCCDDYEPVCNNACFE